MTAPKDSLLHEIVVRDLRQYLDVIHAATGTIPEMLMMVHSALYADLLVEIGLPAWTPCINVAPWCNIYPKRSDR